MKIWYTVYIYLDRYTVYIYIYHIWRCIQDPTDVSPLHQPARWSFDSVCSPSNGRRRTGGQSLLEPSGACHLVWFLDFCWFSEIHETLLILSEDALRILEIYFRNHEQKLPWLLVSWVEAKEIELWLQRLWDGSSHSGRVIFRVMRIKSSC